MMPQQNAHNGSNSAERNPEDEPKCSPPVLVTVVNRDRIREITAQPGETILQAAVKASMSLPSSCRMGICAACRAKLTAGEVQMMVNKVLSEEELEKGYVLVCQSIPITPCVTIEY